MVDDNGEYELLPRDELEKLRDEISSLKQNPLGKGKQGTTLQSSIDHLTVAINSLVSLLTKTNDEMLHDFKSGSLQDSLQSISSQNEKIAQGILSLAHLVQNSASSESDGLSVTAGESNPGVDDVPSPQPAVGSDGSANGPSQSFAQEQPSFNSNPFGVPSPSEAQPQSAYQQQQPLSAQSQHQGMQMSPPTPQPSSQQFPSQPQTPSMQNVQQQQPQPQQQPSASVQQQQPATNQMGFSGNQFNASQNAPASARSNLYEQQPFQPTPNPKMVPPANNSTSDMGLGKPPEPALSELPKPEDHKKGLFGLFK